MSQSPSPAPDLAIHPPLANRAIGGVGSSILAGGLLGATSWLADQLQYPYGLLLPANAIGAWLAVAFVLGAVARTIPTGALRGLIGLLSAVAVYYVLIALFGQGFRALGASHAATIWGGVALVAGPLLGLAGAVWRHGHGWPRAAAVALLAAALIAEGVAFGATSWASFAANGGLADDPGALILAAEALVGLALPAVLLSAGERIRGYVVTGGLAVAAAVAIGPATTVIRALADRF
jgi:hypothetical protein